MILYNETVVKAVIFDLGNVILTNDHPFHTIDELKEFSSYFDITLDNFETAFATAFPPFSLRKLTEDEFWHKFFYTARVIHPNIQFAKQLFRENQAENEHMLSLLSILKNNYRLASLTTISKEWLEFKRQKFGLDDYFESIVASCDYGFSKPDVRIYKELLNKLNLPAKEVLFIDDKELLLPPAKTLGMRTILFRGQKDLEQKLATLHIL